VINRQEYKEALKGLDKKTRVCIKYLEGLTEEKFKLALKVKHPQLPQAPKVNLSKIESTLDSLQKQINGLKPKVADAHGHTQKHHDNELFLKNLIKKAEQVLGEVSQLFDELYESGFFRKEGIRRKIRDEGLIEKRRERNAPDKGS